MFLNMAKNSLLIMTRKILKAYIDFIVEHITYALGHKLSNVNVDEFFTNCDDI